MMFNSDTITWLPSPAKINLFLHICGRLDNGYHALQSVFQLLDYGDQVGFRTSKNTAPIVLKDQLPGVSTENNLIYRAALALLPFRNNAQNVEISLRKALPMGGGIGGGSSNAATVLVALNIFWQCHLNIDALAEIGLRLGADVPVFVRGRTAFASGIGEQLSPISIPSNYYLVATPNVQVSTATIFSHPDLPRNTKAITKSEYRFETTHNDCEILVTKLHSKVANLLQWLLNYAPSRMTGTGASVFAVFTSKAEALEVLHNLPADVKGFVARGVSESPLQKTIAKAR